MDKVIKDKLLQYALLKNKNAIVDDITFNDLNMDDVFEIIDDTSSLLGQEILYGMLRCPLMDIDSINDRLEKIKYYADNEDIACKNTRALNLLPKVKNVSIFEYLDKLAMAPKLSNFVLFRPAVLTILSLIMFFINVPLGILLIVGVYFYNALNYFKIKNTVKPYFTCVSYITKTVSIGNKLSFINTEEYKDIAFLKRGAFLLGNINGETVNNGSGNPLDIFINLLKMGLYIDLIKFNSLTNRVKNYKDIIFKLLEEIGINDAYISIAKLRKKNPDISIPRFTKERRISISDAVHPMIKEAVPNSINTDKCILLTGSNASGKSTFLRMLGINVLLSQSICSVFAKEYESGIFKVMSSMSLVDSVSHGDSFYMAEIKSLKRIVDATLKENNILCFLDEVLKGTNTKERIAAGSSLLDFLSEHALCFAATHDMELTRILEDKYDNYHFTEDVNSGDIHFSYLLKEGPSNTTNAIRLLEQMEFPKEITDNAYNLDM